MFALYIFVVGSGQFVFNCENDLLANLVVLTPKLARHHFRQHIFQSWEWRCAYCGKHLDEHTATIDHIVPKHKGGHNVKSNMAAACSSCNFNKASTLVQFWFTPELPFYCEKRLDKLNRWVEQKPHSIKLPSTELLVSSISNEFHTHWVAN